eukprot:GFKZ01011388.1.p1 GENE.GFKZ01011388.1~~GFKZ01011388.1.p1  ORF type:complete len:282 (-),score=3.95 GFKZ01011388.1:559-1404(-)
MNPASKLFIPAILIGTVLLALSGHVAARASYIPKPPPESDFCIRCRQFGCVVNGGRITQRTPCNPNDPYNPTWLFCEGTGGDDSCGSCHCRKLSALQKRVVQHDLSRGVLFYALHENESLPPLTRCNECMVLKSLQSKEQIIPDNTRYRGSVSRSGCSHISYPYPGSGSNDSDTGMDPTFNDSKSTPDDTGSGSNDPQPSPSDESPPDESSPSCGEIGAPCSINRDCCGTDVCINRRTNFLFGPRFECEPCVQRGATCTSTPDCCGDLTCPRILFRVRTCQ